MRPSSLCASRLLGSRLRCPGPRSTASRMRPVLTYSSARPEVRNSDDGSASMASRYSSIALLARFAAAIDRDLLFVHVRQGVVIVRGGAIHLARR